MEIHVFYRIRERQGLDVPIVSYPLLATALGKYYAPISPKGDSLLGAVAQKRVRSVTSIVECLR